MSTFLQNSIWPNTEGDLGIIKVQIPDGVNTFWPEGDTLVHNFVYKDGKLVGLVDTKALTVNDSKSTVINYDYFDIELPFTEGEITIARGERSKYFNVIYNPINDDNVIITLKYKGCKTVDDVKAVDPNYIKNDIVDGVWSEGLGDLEQGKNMFKYTSITSFSSDLSSLTSGWGMFDGCSNLVSFSADLSSLTTGDHMFNSCGFTSFTSDLSSLTSGDYMFSHCENLTSFSSDLSSLTTGDHMFDCCGLTSFSSDLPSLTSGWGMFSNCENLTSFSVDLSNLKTGNTMFMWCENLTSFTSDMPNLIYGDQMFCYCPNLTSFSSDLSSLTDGSWMFQECFNLSSFTSELPSLTDGSEMFHYCENLSEFNTDLPKLTNGRQMFSHCSKLASFSSDLSSLTNGEYMFQYCKLDSASVQNIADTITTNDSYDATLHIGIANSIPNSQEERAFNTIASRGWTVYVGVANGEFESEWYPTSLTPTDGEEQQTPIPFYAKSVQSDEEHAQYVDENGNFYNILGGNYIYGDDISTYGMFISEKDAAANMRLTKYVKTVEKAK